MEKVVDLKQFSALVSTVKRTGRKVITNCYLLPNEINKYIQQEHIYWDNLSSGIFFLCEEVDFYYLYFYFSEPPSRKTPILKLKTKKPIVVDLVYLESRKDEALSQIEEYFIAHKFRRYKLYKRYLLELPTGERDSTYQYKIDNKSFTFGYPKPSHFNEIQSLWRRMLDVYSIALPDEDEMMALVDKERLLCIFDGNGKLVGVIKQLIDGNAGSLWHLAVYEEYRHQGLARALMLYSIFEHKNVNRFLTWVEESNTPAIKLVYSIGFKIEGKVTRQLLFEE